MPTILFTNDTKESFQLRLNSIIEIKSKDNLLAHFRKVILFENERKVLGQLETNKFKIWIHEQGRSGVTGIFYIVLTGQFKPLGKGFEIELNSKMNIIGKIAFVIISVMLAYGITKGIIIQADNNIEYLIPRILLGSALFGLMILVPIVSYFQQSRTMKNYIIKELGLRNIGK